MCKLPASGISLALRSSVSGTYCSIGYREVFRILRADIDKEYEAGDAE